MKTKKIFLIALLSLLGLNAISAQNAISPNEMKQIYEEVKTPYKYGLVMPGADKRKATDCPTIFQREERWYMYYFVFDGRGYETWMAVSDDLLKWQTLGRVLSFSQTSDWDSNQKGGYIALPDTRWGGSYALNSYDGKYWMSYFGSNAHGYEKGDLSIGIACTEGDPTVAHEWKRLEKPVLTPHDSTVSWWDDEKLYKSMVIEDSARLTGHRFVMYYNAKGNKKEGVERIGMAVSNDMISWERFGQNPVLGLNPMLWVKKGITGDAYLQKINDIWVMFYFGAFWNEDPKIEGWNSFACSRDLIHWTDWEGNPLVQSSESYDNKFAHKSCVIKWKGTVYHYYCSVDKSGNRGIALATSKDMGKSAVEYP